MALFTELLMTQWLLGTFTHFCLPRQHRAVVPRRLQSIRHAFSGILLVALGWYQWHGLWVMLIGAVLLATALIASAEVLVAHRERHFLPWERILLVARAINCGVLLVVILPLLAVWWISPSRILAQSRGAVSWILTLAAVGTLLTALRNLFAVLALTRPPEWVRNPLRVAHPAEWRTVLVSGATGFIGAHFVRRLLSRGDRVVVLTNDVGRAQDLFGPHVRVVTELGSIAAAERIDAIVNLAGATLLGLPWITRRRLLQSHRAETTRGLLRLVSRLECPPGVCISASAIGFYGVHHDEVADEHSGPGETLASALCRDWEAAALSAEAPGLRLVRIRIGVVLHHDRGVLPWLTWALRLFAGAIFGSGSQWVSWIHLEDLLRLFEFTLDRPTACGIYNGVAPAPVTHRELQLQLARHLRRPVWLRIPAGPLRALLGGRAQLLLDGQRVLPNRVVATGFRYRHPQLPMALQDLFDIDLRKHDAATVYFNGDCPVCSTEMSLYAGLCRRAHVPLTFIDSSRSENDFADSGLRGEHLARRVYLRGERGDVLSGMAALVALWRRLPGYTHLARVMSLPGLRQGSELLYDHLIAPALAWWAARRGLRSRCAASSRREMI